MHPEYIIHYYKIAIQTVFTETGKIMGSSPHSWVLATGEPLLHSTIDLPKAKKLQNTK